MKEIRCKGGQIIVSAEKFKELASLFEEDEVDPKFVDALHDLLGQYTCRLLCQHECHAISSSPDNVMQILFTAFHTAQNTLSSGDEPAM